MDITERQVHIRLKPEIFRKLKVKCAGAGISLQDFTEKLITESLMQGSKNGASENAGKTFKSEIIDLLLNCSLFSDMSRQELEPLANVSNTIHYNKGRIIVQEGQAPQSFHIIKTGLVKVFKSFPSGKEFILDVRHDGEIFGEISVIQGVPHYTSAQALEDSEIVSIPMNDFLALMGRNTEAISRITHLEMLRISGLYDRLIGLVADNASQRVAKVLSALTLKYGSTLRFNHREIAEMSGTTIETTSRILSKYKTKGIVGLSRGAIDIIDKEKLESY